MWFIVLLGYADLQLSVNLSLMCLSQTEIWTIIRKRGWAVRVHNKYCKWSELERSRRAMPYRCVAGGCSHTSDDGVAMHKFPADASLASKWSKAIRVATPRGLDRAVLFQTGLHCPRKRSWGCRFLCAPRHPGNRLSRPFHQGSNHQHPNHPSNTEQMINLESPIRIKQDHSSMLSPHLSSKT